MAFEVRMSKENGAIKYTVFEKAFIEGTARTASEAMDDINTGYFHRGADVAEFDDYHEAYDCRDRMNSKKGGGFDWDVGDYI